MPAAGHHDQTARVKQDPAAWPPWPAHHELTIEPVWSTTMPAITQTPETRPHAAPAYYQARPAGWRITGLRRWAHQLIAALPRRARRLRLRRPAEYKLEPMPRMRWYS
jgi:hypothetical protein